MSGINTYTAIRFSISRKPKEFLSRVMDLFYTYDSNINDIFYVFSHIPEEYRNILDECVSMVENVIARSYSIIGSIASDIRNSIDEVDDSSIFANLTEKLETVIRMRFLISKQDDILYKSSITALEEYRREIIDIKQKCIEDIEMNEKSKNEFINPIKERNEIIEELNRFHYETDQLENQNMIFLRLLYSLIISGIQLDKTRKVENISDKAMEKIEKFGSILIEKISKYVSIYDEYFRTDIFDDLQDIYSLYIDIASILEDKKRKKKQENIRLNLDMSRAGLS